MNTMMVISNVPVKEAFSIFQFKRPKQSVTIKVATAPEAAASVGVASHRSISPKTMKMINTRGNAYLIVLIILLFKLIVATSYREQVMG